MTNEMNRMSKNPSRHWDRGDFTIGKRIHRSIAHRIITILKKDYASDVVFRSDHLKRAFCSHSVFFGLF